MKAILPTGGAPPPEKRSLDNDHVTGFSIVTREASRGSFATVGIRLLEVAPARAATRAPPGSRKESQSAVEGRAGRHGTAVSGLGRVSGRLQVLAHQPPQPYGDDDKAPPERL